MGTRARWFSLPWRYRLAGDDLGWTYAETLRDIQEDTKDEDKPPRIQRRTGRKSEGYVYEDRQ